MGCPMSSAWPWLMRLWLPAKGLLAMSVAAGLRMVGELLDAENTAAGWPPKHAKQPQRIARRHGSAPGSLVPGGRGCR
jgi:hypothetical protein